MAGVLGWVTQDEWAAMQNARRRRLRASGGGLYPPLPPLFQNERQAASFDFASWSVSVRDQDNPSLVYLGSPDDFITMTRGSSATYFDANGVMQEAPSNVMRRSQVSETGRMGFLSEWSATNSWATDLSARALYTAAAPHRGVPLALFTGDGATNANWYGGPFGEDEIVTASIFAMKGTSRYITLGLTGATTSTPNIAAFDFDTGTYVYNGNAVTAGAVDLGGGLWRLWVRNNGSISNPTVRGLRIRPSNGDGDQATVLPAGETMIWGAAQVEVRPFISSYIPTTTIAATRSADNARVDLSKLPWSTEHFCIVADFDSRVVHTRDSLRRAAVGVTDGGSDNRIQHTRETSLSTNAVRLGSAGGGGAHADAGGVPGRNRVAIAIGSDGSVRNSANGSAVVAASHAQNLSLLNSLGIAQVYSGLGTLAGHLHSLVVIPRNPTDNELQEWSTL